MKRIVLGTGMFALLALGTAHAQTTKSYSATITITGSGSSASCTGFSANCASGHCTCTGFPANISGNQIGKGSGTLLIDVDFGNTMGGTPNACEPFFAELAITNGTKDPTETIQLQGDVCNNGNVKAGQIFGGFGFENTSKFILGWGKMTGTGLLGNPGMVSNLKFSLSGHVLQGL
ncbi:MAG TPA: hypothetical protein VMT64_03095 [Candidatus Binataceae bacterium]|nr:hypothetical protein [Candidatus Binataceae bacterium]